MKFARFLFINLLLAASVLVAFPQQGSAQQANNIDKKRMSRDLDIMDGILNKLFTNDDSHTTFFMSGNNIDGSYLPAYGVVFRVPSEVFAPPFRYFQINRVKARLNQTRQDIKQQQREIKQEEARIKQEEQQMKAQGKRAKPAPPASPVVVAAPADMNIFASDTSNSTLSKKEILDRADTFLSDYAGAIGQLTPNDRILIIIERDGGNYIVTPDIREINTASSSDKGSDNGNIYISVRESDIIAHRTGKISDAVFRSRISVSNNTLSDQQTREFGIMSNILESAFKDSGNGNITTRGNISYSYLPDYGIIYYMRAGLDMGYYVSTFKSSGSGDVFVANANGSGSKTKESEKKAYNEFISEVKETLVDYGRTLHALKPGQEFLLSINMNGSDQIPNHVTFRISQQTLSGYDTGKISRDQAIKNISVTEDD